MIISHEIDVVVVLTSFQQRPVSSQSFISQLKGVCSTQGNFFLLLILLLRIEQVRNLYTFLEDHGVCLLPVFQYRIVYDDQ